MGSNAPPDYIIPEIHPSSGILYHLILYALNCSKSHVTNKLFICLSVIAFVTKPLTFQPPPKVMQQFFLGYTGPHFGPTNTNHTKNYQKITFGALFRKPPQNALQCSAMD